MSRKSFERIATLLMMAVLLPALWSTANSAEKAKRAERAEGAEKRLNTEKIAQRKPTKLSNPDASPEARKLFKELLSYHRAGKILSGQMWSPWGFDEVEYIYELTGKYPAVRGHDLQIEANNAGEIELMIDWYKKGGIPTLMWHWGAPTKGEGYMQSKQTIDIKQCFVEGTPEHKAMWEDLKRIGRWLKQLHEARVPVLWRPMHEFDGRWFWYGRGEAEDFIRLWRTMYDYYTHEMGLNNLIWVLPHSGEFRAELNPGREYYDIAGADCYSNDRLVDLYSSVERAYGKSNILIPLHECGYLPDPEECRAKGTLWSWWMLWHTDIIRDHDKDWIKKVYADPLILTLDELQRAPKK